LLLGQALGDAIGFVVEAEPPDVAREYVKEWLRNGRAGERSHPQFPFGQYSDDTQLARDLVRSFAECGGWIPADYAMRLAELFGQRRDVGAGPGTRSAAQRLLSGVPWQESGTAAPYAGNGSAMRAGPLGILIPEPSAMCQAAREQSRITHLDPRCAAGSIAVARAVALATFPTIEPGPFLNDVSQCVASEDAMMALRIADLTEWLSLDPVHAAEHVHRAGFDASQREGWQGISAFVIPSVLWSLYAFLRSPDDYWETICTAVAVGGDTDTMAAISGAISGARLGRVGLPSHLVERLNDRGDWNALALIDLAHRAASFINRPVGD
ncbi:MAG TPA: ADP-ribosylglycohydrolase family protein, partial [Gemmatimonadales bacterium]|nr:ADP-ribosylglycohydrolase family protein [Gemmatimonadales bacterium]